MEFGIDFEEGRSLFDARIVDKHIDPSKLFNDLPHGGIDSTSIADVGDDGYGPPAKMFNFSRGGGCGVVVNVDHSLTDPSSSLTFGKRANSQ